MGGRLCSFTPLLLRTHIERTPLRLAAYAVEHGTHDGPLQLPFGKLLAAGDQMDARVATCAN
jgi:hypothetical protein